MNEAQFVTDRLPSLGIETTVESLPLYLLNNDHAHYQRRRQEQRIRKTMEHMIRPSESDWRGLAARRPDSTLWIINGQHHAEAALRKGIESLPFDVFESPHWMVERVVFLLFQEWQAEHLR